MSTLDCVIVGYNDVDFHEFSQKQRQFRDVSGAYSELQTNSVLLNGKRTTYMDLLNHVLTRATQMPWRLNAFDMPNLGVAYLASFLKRRKFYIDVVNFFNFDRLKLAALLLESPRAVAITTTYYVDDEPIQQIVKFIRQYDPEVKVIVGGPRIFNICYANSIRTQDLIFRGIGADIYINDSQGEGTLAEVIKCLRDGSIHDLSKVPNLIYKTGNKTFQRTSRVIENNSLDENAVDWCYFDRMFYVPTTYMRTARSCAFSCSFCNYPAFAGAHTIASIDTIESEMRYLYEAGVRNLIFIDDTFNVPLPRFKNICRMMIRNSFEFQWISFFRCSNADDEAFDLMRDSGCIGVFLGIESADQRILDNMNKFSKVDKYRDGIQKLHERGIFTLASLIVGFPGETQESVLNTVKFLQNTPSTFYNVQLYYNDLLAPIQKRKEEFGLSGSGYSWHHNSMDWREAIYWKEYMINNVENSIVMPLYGFSIWTLPYLMQHGLSLEHIISFSKDANELLLHSMTDNEFDLSDKIHHMSNRFENFSPSELNNKLEPSVNGFEMDSESSVPIA